MISLFCIVLVGAVDGMLTVCWRDMLALNTLSIKYLYKNYVNVHGFLRNTDIIPTFIKKVIYTIQNIIIKIISHVSIIINLLWTYIYI